MNIQHWLKRVILCFAVLSICSINSRSVNAAGNSLIELKVGKSRTVYKGRIEGQNSQTCWLMSREGELHQLPVKNIKDFKRISPTFKRFPTTTIRSTLLKEFGRNYEVATSRNYLTVAPHGHAKTYSKLQEEIYRDFRHYFRVRGFGLSNPDFPMITIVFPDHKSFLTYCKKDGVKASSGLRGYYQPRTNRIALFTPNDQLSFKRSETRSPLTIKNALTPTDNSFPALDTVFTPSYLANIRSVEGSLRDTLIHEGTHQIAFNMKLHSRLGDNPRWIVEGLAMVFESPGVRSSSRNVKDKINSERHLWFKEYSQKRRKKNSLAEFVSTDRLFQTASLDAYSEAWALSFYLLQTRHRQYVEYLKLVADRSDGKQYTSQRRLQDFEKIFGHNLAKLEADYLRYHKKLKR